MILLTGIDADLSGTIHKYLAIALRFSLMKIVQRLRQRYQIHTLIRKE